MCTIYTYVNPVGSEDALEKATCAKDRFQNLPTNLTGTPLNCKILLQEKDCIIIKEEYYYNV